MVEKKPKSVEELEMAIETFTIEVSSIAQLRVSAEFKKRTGFCVQEERDYILYRRNSLH